MPPKPLLSSLKSNISDIGANKNKPPETPVSAAIPPEPQQRPRIHTFDKDGDMDEPPEKQAGKDITTGVPFDPKKPKVSGTSSSSSYFNIEKLWEILSQAD
jgi:hypothetical protein